MSRDIKIIKAAENNLKDISIRIPLNKITVVSGVSGSGKSSLMFGVLLAESERRTRILNGSVSEFEKYNRSHFFKLEYPTIIYGLSQRALHKSEISTVGTVSGLNNIIKKLLIKNALILCQCGCVVDNVCSFQTICHIVENNPKLKLLYKIKNKKQNIDRVLDVISQSQLGIKEIFDSHLKKINIKQINNYLDMDIYAQCDIRTLSMLNNIDSKKILLTQDKKIVYDFSFQTFCANCQTEYQVKSPSLFTKSELSERNGRCKICNGSGFSKRVNFDKLIDKTKRLNEVFLNIPHTGKAYKFTYIQDSDIRKLVGKENYSLHFSDLPIEISDKLIIFIEKKIIPLADKADISPYIIQDKCCSCHGTGFSYKTNAVKIRGMNFYDFINLTVDQLADYLHDEEAQSLIQSFKNLSLSHLWLSRTTDSLSGGELQRLKLINFLSDKINNKIIILDEPSSGLSQTDVVYLYKEIVKLNQRGNTVLIIDHADYLIQKADHSLHFGNQAGEEGGYITNFQIETFESYQRKVLPITNYLEFYNLKSNNLQISNLKIPLNQLIGVIGVSGSGKTSLVNALISKCNYDYPDYHVIHVKQDDLHSSQKSIIATLVGIFDEIRNLYASTELSLKLGFNASFFSFNTPEGACDICNGNGIYKNSLCKKCSGKRYDPKVQVIQYKQLNIVELLNTPIKDLEKLNLSDRINKLVSLLVSMGAGYLSLGRATNTLSGGELQRIKLAKFLLQKSISKKYTHTIIFLDEPTKGLSKQDSLNIIKLLDEILHDNCTIICIEHNNVLINLSDYLIELGPRSGSLGGKVVFSGETAYYKNQSSALPSNQYVSVSSIQQENDLDCAEWLDDPFFHNLYFFSKNYQIKTPNNLTLYNNRTSLLESLKKATDVIYFCPFINDIYTNKVISKSTFSSIINSLKKLGIKQCFWNQQWQSLAKIKPVFEHNQYLNFLCPVDNLELLFDFAGGCFITIKDQLIHYHSIRLIDSQHHIVGPEVIDYNFFNWHYAHCEYCSGKGYVPDIKDAILENNFKIYEKEFYFKLKIKNNISLFNLQKSIKIFKNEMIVDLDKIPLNFNQLECLYAIYGIKGVYFINSTNRKNALEERISWDGLLQILDDVILSSFAQTKCLMCNGTGYIKEIDYYIWNGRRIYEI